MADGWATLYARIHTSVYTQIVDAARADERTIAKWVEMHFRDYFAGQTCGKPSSNTSQESQD